MPTQRNYNKYKDSILKDIHQGKDIDLLSTEYCIPQALIKEWVEKEEQDNDLDIVISELSSKSRDKFLFEKAKSILVFHILRERFLILVFAVIAIGVILAFLSMYKTYDVANEKEEVSLKLDTILESHKRIGMSIINSEEKKLLLLKDAIHILKRFHLKDNL